MSYAVYETQDATDGNLHHHTRDSSLDEIKISAPDRHEISEKQKRGNFSFLLFFLPLK